MKTIKRAAVRGFTLLALAGLLGVGAPQLASADEWIDTCDLSRKITELQGWGSDKSSNVIVYKASSWKSSHFTGIVTEGRASAKACADLWGADNYYWVVFKGDGEFTRQGDGSLRNWAYFGNVDRNDNVLKFHRR